MPERFRLVRVGLRAHQHTHPQPNVIFSWQHEPAACQKVGKILVRFPPCPAMGFWGASESSDCIKTISPTGRQNPAQH